MYVDLRTTQLLAAWRHYFWSSLAWSTNRTPETKHLLSPGQSRITRTQDFKTAAATQPTQAASEARSEALLESASGMQPPIAQNYS